MEGLLMEINELSRRNDELMVSKDSDNVLIRDLDNQLKEYKRKYEQAKTELRSVKGETTASEPAGIGLTLLHPISHFTAVPPSAQVRQGRGSATDGARWWCAGHPHYSIPIRHR